MHQDKLQFLPAEAVKALGVKIRRTLFVDALMFMVEVVVVEPAEKGFINILNRRQMDVLQDEVSLDEPEQAFDFALGLRFPAVERVDPKLLGIPLIAGLSGGAPGLKLGSLIGQDGLRQTIANKRFIHHLVDIYPILTKEPLAIRDEPAVVVDRTDEVKFSNQWQVGLAHDIDLPESVGMRSFKPYHPLDRRQSDPAEMMADQNPADRISMEEKLQLVANKSG